MAALAAKSSGGGTASVVSSLEQAAMYPNPASHLDPELHMVILEYRNAAGQITETLPTTQQLDQYRMNLTEGPGSPNPKAAAAASLTNWG